MRSFAPAVHLAVAALLTVAALLKAWQAVGKPDVSPLWSRLFDAALIEFELALAAMLVLNLFPLVVWGIVVATFTVFLGVSVKKIFGGANSCGCFGPITVDPRVTGAVDLVMLVLLLIAGPRPRRIRQSGARRPIAALFIFLMIACAAAVAYAAAPKRGLVAQDPDYDFGILAPDRADRCEHIFLVRNTSSRALTITGWQSSCGCTTADVPTHPIPPGQAAEVLVRANWSGVTGQPYARITLETDNRWTRHVPLVIHSQIPASPALPTTSPQ